MMSTVGLLVALTLSQVAAPAPAGRISGRVTAADSNTPIAGARIMLFPAGMMGGPNRMPPQAVTDRNGRFVLERIAAGDYHIDVQKPGFTPLTLPPDPPRMITVVPGESLTDVDFQLQKGGAITGRLLDANGEPMVDAPIMAIRRDPSVSGLGLFPGHMQGGQQTNDLGEFRVFGLVPGEYLIAAMPRGISPFGGANMPPPPSGTARTTTAMTYYPGTTDADAAQRIVIAPGAEVGGIVFAMQTTPAFSVSGIVVDESNNPVANAMVMLMGDPSSGMFGPSGSAQSQEDGRFEIGEVPAGRYSITASIMVMGGDPNVSIVGSGTTAVLSAPAAAGFTFGTGAPADAPTEIVVADADVENVRVVTRAPNR